MLNVVQPVAINNVKRGRFTRKVRVTKRAISTSSIAAHPALIEFVLWIRRSDSMYGDDLSDVWKRLQMFLHFALPSFPC